MLRVDMFVFAPVCLPVALPTGCIDFFLSRASVCRLRQFLGLPACASVVEFFIAFDCFQNLFLFDY